MCPACRQQPAIRHIPDREPGTYVWYVRCACPHSGATHADHAQAYGIWRDIVRAVASEVVP